MIRDAHLIATPHEPRWNRNAVENFRVSQNGPCTLRAREYQPKNDRTWPTQNRYPSIVLSLCVPQLSSFVPLIASLVLVSADRTFFELVPHVHFSQAGPWATLTVTWFSKGTTTLFHHQAAFFFEASQLPRRLTILEAMEGLVNQLQDFLQARQPRAVHRQTCPRVLPKLGTPKRRAFFVCVCVWGFPQLKHPRHKNTFTSLRPSSAD